MTNLLRQRLQYISIFLALIISFSVLIGWYIKSNFILKYIAGDAGMKFNTAALFFLITLILLNQQRKFLSSYLEYFLLFFCLVISLFSGLQYPLNFSFGIDNFIIKDVFNTENLGRMSMGTALSFFMISAGLLIRKINKKKYVKIAQFLFVFISTLATVAIVSYILKIPAKNKSAFLETMALDTALLFLILSVNAYLKNKNIGFFSVLHKNLEGSKVLKSLAPVIIVVPITLNYTLIALINKKIVQLDFGIVLYTFFLIAITFLSAAYLSKNLNKSDKKRKKLINDLKESNTSLLQFKTAIDRISMNVITDLNGNITYVNNKYVTTSKYKKEELIGNHLDILNSGHHHPSFFKQMWQQLANGKVWHNEMKNKTKDGEFYWVDVAMVPLLNKTQKIRGYMAIEQDITNRKNAEKSAKIAKSKLIEKNKDLEQFVYIASHDLQEPLRTVTSISEMFYDEYKTVLDETAKSYLEFISGGVNRMHFLVKDLMNHSRLGQELVFENVDINKVLNDISQDLSKIISDTETTLNFEDFPSIYGNEGTIRQLFQNLISNAIKFRAKNLKPIINISHKLKNKEWQFSISDNGIGIKEKDKDKIFKIFKRLHKSKDYTGTGIGLANCKKIVELHEGKIWVCSNEGEGSTFSFTINKNLK